MVGESQVLIALQVLASNVLHMIVDEIKDMEENLKSRRSCSYFYTIHPTDRNAISASVLRYS